MTRWPDRRDLLLLLTVLLGITVADSHLILEGTGQRLSDLWILQLLHFTNNLLFFVYAGLPLAVTFGLVGWWLPRVRRTAGRSFFWFWASLCLSVFFVGAVKLHWLYGEPYLKPGVLVVLVLTVLLGGILPAVLLFVQRWKAGRWSLLLLVLGLTAAFLVQPPMYAYRLPEIDKNLAGKESTNLLVVLVDTVHAAHLSAYGYDRRRTSPHLSRLADTGTVFTKAFSTASWTRPSVASLFTGLSVPSHRTTGFGQKLPRSYRTLAEHLRGSGYRTAAVSSNAQVSPYFGFNQGFEAFHALTSPSPLWDSKFRIALSKVGLGDVLIRHYSRDRPDAPRVNRRALRWLREDPGRPFFLYLHYMDPHAPYDPPRDHLGTRTLPDTYAYSAYEARYMKEGNGKQFKIFPFHERPRPPESIRRDLLYQYDAEIRYWDQHLGRLLDRLRAMDLFRNTLVVVLSDHGEEFLQHGHWKHGNSVFNELIHVPLVVRLPGGTAARRIERPVSLVNVPATLLELLGRDPDVIHGRSFAALVRGNGADTRTRRRKSRPLYAAEIDRGRRILTLIEWPLKIHWIHNGRRTAWRLYNLEQDFAETNDLSSTHPRFGELQNRLRRWFEEHKRASPEERTEGLSPRMRNTLRGLGYTN